MLLKTICLALGASATVLAGSAFAEGHADLPPAVKARQSHMQLYSFNLGQLGGMARGDIEYNAETAATAATSLSNVSQLSQDLYYPEGTSSDEVMGTRALPAIWEDMDAYAAANEKLREATAALVEVAGDGQEALGGGLRAVGQACGGCHQKFQMEN